MTSKTVYNNDFVQINLNLETNEELLKFTISKHLKMDNSQIISVILNTLSWEFSYMSDEALRELLKGVISLVKNNEKLSEGDIKLFKLIERNNRERLIKLLWELILNGEGLSSNLKHKK